MSNADNILDTLILNGVEYILGGSVGTRYSITFNLSNITPVPNRATIAENTPLQVSLTADSGYEIESSSVVVTMGGVNITEDVYSGGIISIPAVTDNVSISGSAKKAPIDLLNVTWANHAITCGQDTNNYNAWSPHNLQYDDTRDEFVFLQCHANKHLSPHTLTTWTLSIINPYDANDVENITVPTYEGLGMLFVENGTWTLLPRGGSEIYQSSDRGLNWTTIPATVPTYLFGVYKCGDTYFAGNDSNTEITYYRSNDLITWATESFDSNLGYAKLCETTFCEYGGKYWAFNRTNDSTLGHPVILQSTDNGDTWTLFSDSDLHGYRSTVSCYPFKNYIMVADIDRDNGYLYYNKFDGTTFTELNSWKVPHAGDDFHNVNIVSNYKDTVIIEFMHGASGIEITEGSGRPYRAQYACDNVMIVGSTKELPSLTFDYIDTKEALVAFLNAHCTTGVNSNRTYSWSNFGNNNIQCNFGETVSGFDDEIEIPLNLISLNAGSRLPFTIKYGSSYAKAWSNTTTDPSKTTAQATIDGTMQQAFIYIDGVRYTLGIDRDRTDVFPVLTRQNYIVPLNAYTPSGQNSFVGEAWQENLGFRRVYPVNYSTTADEKHRPSIINEFGTAEHPYATISYTPVN